MDIESEEGLDLYPMDPLESAPELIDHIVQANIEANSLEALWIQARRGNTELLLEDDLLIYNNRLIIPDINYFHMELIKEVYE